MSNGTNLTKVCPECGEELPTKDFYRDSSTSDGFHYWCKTCCKAYGKHYRGTKEGKATQARYNSSRKGKATAARFYASEKGKRTFRQSWRRRGVRKAGAKGFHAFYEFVFLCEATNFRCLACKKAFPLDELTEDHIVPLSQGGSDDISNIQPLCRSCNASKGVKTIDYRKELA